MKSRNYLALLLLTGAALTQTVSAQQYEAFHLAGLNLAERVCATCHGPNGKGNPIVGGPRLADIEPWYLRNQLIGFRSEFRGTQKDYIPGYEMQDSVARMSDAEIAEVVAYISSWSASPNAPTITGNTNRGSELYASCAACHGIEGQGNEALAAPGLTEKDDWYLFRQLNLFKSGYRGGHPEDQWGQQMRASTGILETSQDINDVLAYINTLGN